MRNRYFWIVLALILFLTGCEETNKIKPSGKVITVGVIAPLSGESRSIGLKALKGLEAAQAMYPLTTKGDRIKLIVRDDTSNAGTAAALISELAKEQKVQAVVSLSTSDGVLTMTPAVNQFKLPSVAAIASHESITGKSSYISRICMSNAGQSRIAAYFAHDELLFDKAAIFYDDDSAYSNSLARFFQKEFEKIEGKVVGKVTSDLSDSDFERELSTLKQQGVELFYTSVKGAKALRFLQLREKLEWKVAIIGSEGLLSSLKEHGLEDQGLVEGVFITENYADDAVVTAEEKRLNRYVDKKDITLNTHSYLAYEGYLLLLDALSKCSDQCSSDELNSRLRNQHSFSGINDRMSMKEGEVQRPIFINKIHKGKMLMHLKVY